MISCYYKNLGSTQIRNHHLCEDFKCLHQYQLTQNVLPMFEFQCNGGPSDGRRYQETIAQWRSKSRKIFQPKNNRILSSRFRGRVATLLTDNATETGNTGWQWPSCREPIHPHLRLYPLCLLAHHRSWYGHPNSWFGRRVFLYTTTPTLVWVKSFLLTL